MQHRPAVRGPELVDSADAPELAAEEADGAEARAVAGQAPGQVVLSGPSGPTKSTSASFTFSSAGSTSFGCALDGAAAVPCTSPYAVSSVSDGSHTLVVTASDTAGNPAQPGTATWSVDTHAPAAPTFSVAPADPTTSTSASFAFASEPDATFTCALDSQAAVACTSP